MNPLQAANQFFNNPRFPDRLYGPGFMVLLFWLSGDFGLWLLIPYAAFILPSMGPLPLMFGSLEATELMMSLGFRRTYLVRWYLREVLLSSALHAAAFALGWYLRGFDRAGMIGLGANARFLQAFIFFLSAQLMLRSIYLLIFNSPLATCFSARWRGCWAGDGRSFARQLVTALLGFVIIVVPIAGAVTAAAFGRPLWIAVPAGLCFLALVGIVRTVEFSSFPTTWELNRDSFRGRLSRAKVRPGAVRALAWNGLATWTWATFALFMTPSAVIVLLKVVIPERMMEDQYLLPRVLWFSLSGWWILLLIAGGRLFLWSSEGDSGEVLHMAGLQPAYLRRFKLLTAAGIVLGAGLLGWIGLTSPFLGFRDDVAPFLAKSLGSFVILAGAAHVLLWMNESPVMTWKGRALRGTKLAEWARGFGFILIVISVFGERLSTGMKFGGTDIDMMWPLWIGLAFLIPAVALWFVGWFRAGERESS